MIFLVCWGASSEGFEIYHDEMEFENEAAAEDWSWDMACAEFADNYIGYVDGCDSVADYVESGELTEQEACEHVDEIMCDEAFNKVLCLDTATDRDIAEFKDIC